MNDAAQVGTSAFRCALYLAGIADDLLIKRYTHLRLTRYTTPHPEIER